MIKRKWAEKVIKIMEKEFGVFLHELSTKKGVKTAMQHAGEITIAYVPSETYLKVEFCWLKPKQMRKI